MKQKGTKSAELIIRDLFLNHYPALCQLAYKYVKSEAEAEDIVQGVFSSIWQKREQLEWDEKIVHYFYKATKNNAIDRTRRAGTQSFQDESFFDEIPQDDDQLDSEMVESIKLQLVKMAIDKLPPRCKEIFTLQKLGGMTYQEIAEELDISVKTVENQMVKALSFIREYFESNRTKHGI